MDFLVTMPFFYVAMPEIFLLVLACTVLLTDVFLAKRYQSLTYYFSQLTVIVTFILVLFQLTHFSENTVTFNGHYVLDRLALIAKSFVCVFSFFAFAYAKDYIVSRRIAFGEYYLLSLFAVLGMLVMISAHSLLTIYLGLELLSLALYAMVAMYKESSLATEAAMKYFILGSFASGLLLYGISLIYGATSSVDLSIIMQVLQTQSDTLMILALVFVLGGLLFKFGAVPFHIWVPDVYQGAPTPVTLFIASAPKIAAFIVIIRLLIQALPSLQTQWEPILILVSVLSMFFGNVLAIVQSNLKRMLAYSSIAHIGYTLLGIIAGPHSPQGYSAALFYISTYVVVAAGAFAIITLMSRDGADCDRLDDYRGLNARHPWLAFMMLLLLFSMAGVPPTVGFFAKLGLIEALVQAHYVSLAVFALIFALIGAYYYLRVVMLMYFEEPTEERLNQPLKLSPSMWVAISLNGGSALLLGLLPSFFIDLCRISI